MLDICKWPEEESYVLPQKSGCFIFDSFLYSSTGNRPVDCTSLDIIIYKYILITSNITFFHLLSVISHYKNLA